VIILIRHNSPDHIVHNAKYWNPTKCWLWSAMMRLCRLPLVESILTESIRWVCRFRMMTHLVLTYRPQPHMLAASSCLNGSTSRGQSRENGWLSQKVTDDCRRATVGAWLTILFSLLLLTQCCYWTLVLAALTCRTPAGLHIVSLQANVLIPPQTSVFRANPDFDTNFSTWWISWIRSEATSKVCPCRRWSFLS